MEDKGGATGYWESDSEDIAGILEVVRVKVVEESEAEEADMNKDPDTEEDGAVA